MLLLLCTGVVAAALLLFVVACRMVTIVSGALNLIPCSVSFSSFKHDLVVMHVPLGSTVVFTASICLHILGNYGYARSQGVFMLFFFCQNTPTFSSSV